MNSLQFKISAIAGTTTIIIVTVLTLLSFFELDSTKKNMADQSSSLFSESVLGRIQSSAKYQASEIAKQLKATQLVSESLAASLHQYRSLHQSSPLLRKNSIEILASVLDANPQFLGIYGAYEPNAYDGRDRDFINDKLTASDQSGRFISYVARSDTGVVWEALVDYENASRDKNGIRAGEYYLCPKDRKVTCITDPYTYPINGKDVLLASITSPVVESGQFQGIVGVDIGLEFIQKFIENQNKDFFGGQGSMAIVSQNGIVSGFTGRSNLLGKTLEGDEFSNWNQLRQTANNEPKVVIYEHQVYAISPIIINDKPTGWSILIALPDTVISSSVDQLTAIISKSIDSLNQNNVLFGLLGAIIAVISIAWVIGRVLKPIRYTVDMLKDLAEGDGDLTARLAVKSKDEVGEMAACLNQFLEQMHNIISEIESTSVLLSETAEKSYRSAEVSHTSMQQQQSELNMTVSAVEEMNNSSTEVAGSAASASSEADKTFASVQSSKTTVIEAVNSINKLASEVKTASSDMDDLAKQSEDISKIIVTIQSIAEQTNLLALNAAIEAARAGESGRGFAVVADEVRLLAQRTQVATSEIQEVIEQLQSGSSLVSAIMKNSQQYSVQSVEKVDEAKGSLDEIQSHVHLIKDMSQQIAVASSEQSQVTEEINRNMSNVDLASVSIGEQVEKSNHYAKDLHSLAETLNTMVRRFKL